MVARASTCTHPSGCLPGFALCSLRIPTLLFFFYHSTSILFIYLSCRLQSNISSQDLIVSTETGHIRAWLQHVCVCGDAVKMPHPAAWWSPSIPPPDLTPPAKGMSEDAASHRRAPLCTSSPHGGQISGYETVSEERLPKVGGGGREEAGGSAGAAVNQQINSQTDQSPPQFPRANGRTCLRPVPGMLESNWER